MDTSDWISTLLAVVSLAIVVYKEFFEGPRLRSSLDQLGSLRLGEAQKKDLLLDMFLDDLMAATPSDTALKFMQANPTVRAGAQRADRESLKQIVVTTLSRPPGLNYSPSDELVRPYLRDPRFGLALYLPLIVANSGKRVGHIGSLLLIFEAKGHPRQRFVFSAMAHVDSTRLLKRSEKQTDSDRMGDVFAGISVLPGSSITVHLLMVPMNTVGHRVISSMYLQPGEYRVALLGFGIEDEPLLAAHLDTYHHRDAHMVSAFHGNETLDYLSAERHVARALIMMDGSERLAPYR